jgi:hypothetical protein
MDVLNDQIGWRARENFTDIEESLPHGNAKGKGRGAEKRGA